MRVFILIPLKYEITARSRILPQKFTSSQLVRKFPAFYGTRRFITTFASALHLSLSSSRAFQSTPHRSTSWRSILILSSHLRLGLPNGHLSSGLLTKTVYHLSCPPYMLHAPSISFFLIWSPEFCLVRGTALKAPRFVVFSTPLSPRRSWTQISFSAPYSWTPSTYVRPLLWQTKPHTHTKITAFVWHNK